MTVEEEALFEQFDREARLIARGRARRALGAGPPTLAKACKRLAAACGGSQPWLTPAAAEAPDDVLEVMGSETYRKV